MAIGFVADFGDAARGVVSGENVQLAIGRKRVAAGARSGRAQAEIRVRHPDVGDPRHRGIG